MCEIAEAVAFSTMDDEVVECPFKLPPKGKNPDPDSEDYAEDDKLSVAKAAVNSGGVLGENLENGRPGTEGKYNHIGVAGLTPSRKEEQKDTARDPSSPKVQVDGKEYPYTVAAHHLIPGNASLYESSLFKRYMQQGGTAEVKTKNGMMNFKITHNIGYNVNGSHNGVWLPGSYAVRAGVHPTKVTWGKLIRDDKGKPTSNTPWCYDYMAVVASKAEGQFHDAHTTYNRNAKDVLNKKAVRLMAHQAVCEDHCQKEPRELPPPYTIKNNLFALSDYFYDQAKGDPTAWRTPWITSDQVYTDIRLNKARWDRFIQVYRAGKS
jgi:hypothetical protein